MIWLQLPEELQRERARSRAPLTPAPLSGVLRTYDVKFGRVEGFIFGF